MIKNLKKYQTFVVVLVSMYVFLRNELDMKLTCTCSLDLLCAVHDTKLT